MDENEDVQDEPLDAPASEAPQEPTHLKLTDYERARIEAVAKGEDPDAIERPSQAKPSTDDLGAGDAQGSADPDASEEDVEEDAEAPKTWYTDRDRAFAENYGLSEYDLAELSGRDELKRLAQTIDRQRAQYQRPAPETKGEETDQALAPLDEKGRINPDYYKNGEYDEATVAMAEAARKTQEQLEALQSQYSDVQRAHQEAQERQYVEAYHDAVDGLELNDFFGRSVDAQGHPVRLAKKFGDRREQLHRKVEILALGYQASGDPVPSMRELVQEANYAAFRGELAGQQRQTKLEKIADQSKRRRPVSSGASAAVTAKNAPHADRHSSQAILQDPTVSAFLQRIQDERGVTL